MCRLVIQAIEEGNTQVIEDVRRIVGEPEDSEWLPQTPQALCNRILHTAFMGTTNSSNETRLRARLLAESIGCYHIDLNIDSVVLAQNSLFSAATGFEPHFTVHGGSKTENLSLQNVQARLRMVTAYQFAQMVGRWFYRSSVFRQISD